MRHISTRRHLIRRGATLLEMVLALSLFLSAFTVLVQIVWNGQRAAIQARLRTEAAFRCETKLSEILSGAEPFQSQAGMAFPDDAGWMWSSVIMPGQYPELMHVTVTVERHSTNPLANASFKLDRWVRDPTSFVEAALQQANAAAAAASSAASAATGANAKNVTNSAGGSR